MQLDSNNASPSSPVEERPLRKRLLVVACIIGILIGLGVFGFVCYLLLH
jgi:hypothetical protein